MDDILASIRRIIADEDVLPLSRRPVVTAQAPAPVAAAPVRAPQAASEPAPAPRAPLLKLRDFAPRPVPAPVSAPAPAPVSAPAPVAAVQPAPVEDRKESPLIGLLRPSLPEAFKPSEADKPAEPVKSSVVSLTPPAAPFFKPVAAPLRASSVFASAPEAAPAPERPAAPPLARTEGEPSVKAESQPTVRTEAPRMPISPRAPEQSAAPRAPEPFDSSLLSQTSGAKVGAAFEALAESMLMRDPEMIERLARDMLRPMLKSWLDDNLPIVVERLVRAEIERVARGR